MRRRLLRYFLVGLVLLLLGGLWAFSFFLFNPFEGDYGYPVASLVPRDVDFYAYKGELGEDFDGFPRLVLQDALESSPAGQALLDLGIRDTVAGWNLGPALDELDRSLAELPVQLDPLSLFGGGGLAVAGTFAGPDLAGARWALYGRTSWFGKLGVELVAGDFLGLDSQGISLRPVEHEGRKVGVEISGGQLTQPLCLARIQDVVIVSNASELLVAARDLAATRGKDSLDRSAKYTDHVVRTGDPGDELEIYLDQRAMAEELKLAGTWPDPNSNDFVPALCARLFQLGAVREMTGTLDFAPTSTLDLVAELSSNVLSPFQQRLYEERGFEKEQMLEAARIVPADAGFFVYLHADIGDLLRELRSVVQLQDPALISNLEDFVRAAWNYPDLDPLIKDIDDAVRDRVGFFLRDYDYPPEVGDRVPPHDDTPVLAWAVVLWPKDQAEVDGIRKVIERDDVVNLLKIQGATPGSSGLWENTLQGGAKIKEYWNALVPGTGHIATLEMQGREPYLVITNENRLLGQVFKVYTTGRSDEGLTRLAEATAYQTWVQSGLGSANLLAWAAPREMEASSRRIAAFTAARSGADTIDWSVERPRIEREVAAQSFPGQRPDQLAGEDHDAFERQVQEAVDRFQDSYLRERLPALQAESERWLRAQRALRAGFLELASDRKRLHLQARLSVDFEPAKP